MAVLSSQTSWQIIDRQSLRDEAALVKSLIAEAGLDAGQRARITAAGADLVRRIRASVKPGLMEVFLAEYGLSTDEGIALMCLAEALLRVPDAETMDVLIEDKIAPSNWGKHLGQSASSLVNASTWALMLTGKVLEDREPGVVGHLRAAVKRLGEPVIRRAVAQAMKEMGRQFVLGETIEAAMKRAEELEGKGYTYSYDMLGEAARTEGDTGRLPDLVQDAVRGHDGRREIGQRQFEFVHHPMRLPARVAQDLAIGYEPHDRVGGARHQEAVRAGTCEDELAGGAVDDEQAAVEAVVALAVVAVLTAVFARFLRAGEVKTG